MLKDLGAPEDQAKQLVDNLRKDDFERIRAAFSMADAGPSPTGRRRLSA